MILLGQRLIKGDFYRLSFRFSAYADYLIQLRNGSHEIFHQKGQAKMEFCEVQQTFEARAKRVSLKVENVSVERDSVIIDHLEL